ncbi:MAG: lytic transglycosylase domain-containing protein [Parvibaculum sp.]|nr:lytic transglycosylase domain-containing protein [Parvibaculum sp.]
MSLVETIGGPQTIHAALAQASERTGADFDYLLKTAMRESSLDHQAKSSTSSASGLFQFTEQSWLGTLKKYGAELGLGHHAEAISRTPSGRYVVENTAERQEILALRFDASASALMAGAYTQESAGLLENRLGRSTSEGELYIAHFLGAGGAGKLISAAENTPSARADSLFPAAAAANQSIFYDRAGRARTAAEVYQNLVSKHENADASQQHAAAKTPPLSQNSHKTVTNGRDGHFEGPAKPAQRGYATRGATMLSPGLSPTYTPAMSSGANSGPATRYGAALKLTPGIVEVLAALDPIPQGSASLRQSERSDERREEARAEERRERARLLPRSGFSFG